MGAALQPFPVAVVPPKAPPTVVLNPKRKVVLDIDLIGVTPTNVTLLQLRQAVTAQMGIGSSTTHFVVEYCHAWGSVDPTTAEGLVLTESRFSIKSSGDSTVVDRARAGISYPKNVQPHFGPSDADATVVFAVSQTGTPTSLTIRVGVICWDA